MDQLAAPGLRDRILVWWYSETVAYTLESCDWCSPDSFGQLHFSVAQFIQDQLNLLYAEFSEHFTLAEFPDVQEQLEPSEAAVFLKAAGAAPDDADFSSIENYDCFSGLCAVIRHRLDHADWVQNQLALRIFFWIAEMYKVEIENEAG